MKPSIVAKPIEFGLRLMDFWPRNSFGPYFTIIILIFNCLVIFIFWEAICGLKNWTNLISIIDDISASLLFSIKYAITWSKRGTLKEIFTKILEDWENAKEASVKRIIAEKFKLVQVFWIFTNCFYLSTAFFFVTSTVAINSRVNSTEERQFVVHLNFPFNVKASPIFEIMSFLQIFPLATIVFANALLDTIYIMLVYNASAMLDLVKEEIIKFSVINKKRHNRELVLKIIKKVVNGYQDVLNYCQKVEDIYSIQILVHVISSTFLICCNGYMLMTIADFKVNFYVTIKFLLFLISSLLELFAYCFGGEYLRTKSESIQNFTYDCFWYKMHPADSKALLLIMLRSQKPIKVTAGKFMDITLHNYTNILKVSASYLSVLRTVRDKSQ